MTEEPFLQQLRRGRFVAWLKVAVGLSLMVTAISAASQLFSATS
ncbi:MAG: hypothetical protein ACLGIB_12455 [Actinomycetota bacterium]